MGLGLIGSFDHPGPGAAARRRRGGRPSAESPVAHAAAVSRLMNPPAVADPSTEITSRAIDDLLELLESELAEFRHRVLCGLFGIASVRPGDFLAPDGVVRSQSEWPAGADLAVEFVDRSGPMVAIRIACPLETLNLLGSGLQLWRPSEGPTRTATDLLARLVPLADWVPPRFLTATCAVDWHAVITDRLLELQTDGVVVHIRGRSPLAATGETAQPT